MTDPILVPCPEGQWTLVATNVTECLLHIKKLNGATYYITEIDTGGSAPTIVPQDPTSVALPMSMQVPFNKSTASDLYVYCLNASGVVRVSV